MQLVTAVHAVGRLMFLPLAAIVLFVLEATRFVS